MYCVALISRQVSGFWQNFGFLQARVKGVSVWHLSTSEEAVSEGWDSFVSLLFPMMSSRKCSSIFFFFFGCTIMSGSDNLGASTEPSFNSMKIASLLTTAISISILSLVSTKGKLSWVQKCSNPQHFLYLIILILTFKVSSDCIFDLSHKTDILFFRQKSWKNFLQ